MDSIVEKLSEIEATAQSIVEHAELQKPVMEKEIQEKRNEFDQELELETQKKIDAIRSKLKEKTDSVLAGQHEKNRSTIDSLIKDFDKNHTKYAQDILKHMTGV